MSLKSLSISAIGLLVLSACGGGGGEAPDTTAPIISGVTVSTPSNGKVTLTASASDNQAVTGYCLKTDAAVPAASNGCFTTDAAKSIDSPATDITYYTWTKDAAGNVSTVFSKALTDAVPPVVTGVTVSTPSNGQLTLTATASDATGVTGYCFKTDATAPASSDSCFTSLATKHIATPSTTSHYYLWAKDAAGNLSLAFDKTLTDGVAPTISGVSVSAPNNGQVTLTATASDATGVTGYCFKTDATAPADNCFSANTALNIATPTTPTRYYIWSRDAANNLSAVFERVAGACSATGVTASQSSALPTVCVSTSLGEFVLALESTKAPITTANFLRYVNDGFYSQTVFHRVMSNFMIQGGGFTGVPISNSNYKTPTYSAIALEPTTSPGLSNTTGTIAMARTNPLNSATSQFFINVVNNTGLNGNNGYAVFGNVISGLDTTVQSIRNLPVQSNGSEVSQPLTPPVINWAYQLK